MKFVPFLLIGGLLILFGWMIMRLSEAALNQRDSESFRHVTGVVASSEVTTTTGSRGGMRYHVHVNYRYWVEGMNYVGHRYRYDGHPTDGASANAIVAAHPAGSAVEVYYNPHDPNDTVLSTGVDREDIAVPFFMAGIILFLLGALIPGFRQLFSGPDSVVGGVKIISEMRVTRVRLPRYEPIKLGLMTGGALIILSAVLILTHALHPPWAAAQWSLAVVLSAALGVYLVQCQKIRSGRQDLVIDEVGRTVQLPLTYKRRERPPISFADIRAVMLNKVRHQSKSRIYYTYLVTLELKDNAREKLVDLKLGNAKAFASWLREKFGVSAPGPEAKSEDET